MRVVKIIIALALAVLLACIGGMIFVVKSKYAINDFAIEVNAAMNAAMIVNAEETHTDAENAVICEYEGDRVILAPENYRAFSTYLGMQSAMLLFDHADRDSGLHICVCGNADVYVSSDMDGDGLNIRWETGKRTYNMHAKGSNIWNRLVQTCTVGSSAAENIAVP